MSRYEVHTYICNRSTCKYVELRSGIRYSQRKCPKCGFIMKWVNSTTKER